MIEEGVNIHTFGNGLRLVHKQVFGTQTSNMGFVINAGSRDDEDSPGIAHCFEHMLFRGTHKRTSEEIINGIECIGGELNAFTAKDVTVVYANVLSDYFKSTMELLEDIVFNSHFTEDSLAKERNIIKEEINLYLDTPEEFIYDEFQALQYPNHPMGYNILGTEDTLANIDVDVLNKFYTTHYTPQNTVLSVVSNLSWEETLTHCQFLEKMGNRKGGETIQIVPATSKQFNILQEQDFNLAYVCLGTEAYTNQHQSKYALMLLNNILGGPGMNSLLNMSLREKYGLTYQIDSSYTSYDNTGIFYINFATDQVHLEKTLSLIKVELDSLCEQELEEKTFTQAKTQFINQLKMAEESKNSLMIYNGKNLLFYNKVKPLSSYIDKVFKLKSKELHQVANELIKFENLSQLKFTPSS